MTNDLIYVYCLTNSPPVLSASLESDGLKPMRYSDFYAIVKNVPENEFSEENFKRNLSDINWLETHARDHVVVINKIMENNPVIPFKFGTLFQSEPNLDKFISNYATSLDENFELVGGKEEWAVKVYCDRKALGDQIDELSEEAAAMEKQIMASSPGKAFLLKRKKTELIETELSRLCKNYGQEAYNEFKALSVASGLNNLLPKEFTGRDDTMILNAVFLVSKENIKHLEKLMDGFKAKHTNFGFFIEATGPWPPFSFISIKEQW